MKRSLASALNRRRVSAAVLALAASAAVLVLVAPGIALGTGGRPVPPPPEHPTSADQIQNIDQVRTAIKAYYGDTTTENVDPVPNAVDGVDKALHTFDPSGAYANELAGLEADASKYLAHQIKHWRSEDTPAILLDVDDTTLNTFSYEIYSNFAYNPATNAYFVNAAVFPAVPGMPDLVNEAADEGYAIFFLTGRPESQRAGTEVNLANEGYPLVSDQLYLKDYTVDTWLSPCAPSCTTTQYKSLTREYIESQGYEIVGNFGDQFSDLNGGFADEAFKVPNPMYYLP